jgi:hypothetical protein
MGHLATWVAHSKSLGAYDWLHGPLLAGSLGRLGPMLIYFVQIFFSTRLCICT